jgi:hypothetical protein
MHGHLTRWVLVLLAALSAANVSGSESRADSANQRLAIALCDTLHDLPARRKQACCGASVASLAAVCAKEVAAALDRNAIRIDNKGLDRCSDASEKSLKGCDWVGPLQPALPAVCAALIVGNAKPGAVCRSSLECSDGLYCQGISPLAPGVCAASARAGARCERPADNLASFARAADDPRHPSCDGVCLRGQCLAKVAEGGACQASAICADGTLCVDGKCLNQPVPKLGKSCSATIGCAEGALCLDGICTAPKAGGASCRLPFECRSLECKKAEGEETGICVDACQVPQSGPIVL